MEAQMYTATIAKNHKNINIIYNLSIIFTFYLSTLEAKDNYI